MKTIIKKEYKFEPGDIKLIMTPAPECPCGGCELQNGGCCGCPKGNEYYAFIRKLEKAGIKEIHQKYHRFFEVINLISDLEDEEDDLFIELSHLGLIDPDDFK